MSRRRRQREKTWEEQRDEAQLEVERAESALQYRKSQLAEAQSELESLGGVAKPTQNMFSSSLQWICISCAPVRSWRAS